MRFSVIIACHNAGRWIGRCLRSVRDQTHPAHEVIVIDDRSTDDSVDQVRSSGVEVRLLQAACGNAAATRNVGIEAATGTHIAILDADDIWYPNHLQRAAELLAVHDDVAFMSNHDWIDLEDRAIPIPPGFKIPFGEPRTGLSHREFLPVIVRGFHFGHLTCVYRTDRVREVGMFDVSQVRRHDMDLWMRVLRGKTWAYDTVKSAGYRIATPGSISSKLASAEYYYLRSFLRNREGYEGPELDQLIRTAAGRGMGLAFVNEPAEFEPMKEIAWPYLGAKHRLFYSVAQLAPAPFRAALKVKRRIFNRLR